MLFSECRCSKYFYLQRSVRQGYDVRSTPRDFSSSKSHQALIAVRYIAIPDILHCSYWGACWGERMRGRGLLAKEKSEIGALTCKTTNYLTNPRGADTWLMRWMPHHIRNREQKRKDDRKTSFLTLGSSGMGMHISVPASCYVQKGSLSTQTIPRRQTSLPRSQIT